MKSYKIAIIGYGNVGKTLEHYLIKNTKNQVIVKKHLESYDKILNVDIIIVAVPDRALKDVVNDLESVQLTNLKAIFHTSGVIKSIVLSPISENYGSFHFPLSIVYEAKPNLYEKFVMYEGSENAKNIFNEVFNFLHLKLFTVKDKYYYHYICTLFANIPFYFMNHAFGYLKKENIPKEVGLQLINSALKNIEKDESFLTGPIIRRDLNVLNLHKESIKDKNERELYEKIIEFFIKLNERGD